MELTQPPLRVMIAAERPGTGRSLAAAVKGLGSAEVTVEAHSAGEALEAGIKAAPDVALVDLCLSPDCGLVAALHAACPDTRIIALADRSSDDARALVNALASGAVGAVYKESSLTDLTRALQVSSRTTPVVAEEAAGLLLGSYLDALTSKRERDVATIEALAAALEVRDVDTGQHLRRGTELGLACMERIDPDFAKNEEIAYGFMLHDVGKIGIPDSILLKPGPLNESEWNVMRRHPEVGTEIVHPIGFSRDATDIILHHHERWDGSGYPFGLSKDEIPLSARTFAIVDAYDAMTSDRPYRYAMAPARALEVLHDASGSEFDPDILDVFIDVIDAPIHS